MGKLTLQDVRVLALNAWFKELGKSFGSQIAAEVKSNVPSRAGVRDEKRADSSG
jgi:hypothetical protein